MAQRDYTGWSSQTSYGVEETAYGTKSAAINLPFGKVISCGIKADAPVIEHRSKSSGRNVGKKVPGRVKVAGPIEFSPQNGLFLQYALGEKKMGAMGDGSAVPVAASDANEVVSGCNLTETGTPDMNVNLAAAGSYDIGSANFTTTVLAPTITAAHATLDRVDIISIKDSTGTTTETVTAGTAAASPVPDWASVPTDELVIALVWVAAAVTVINTTDVKQVFWIKEASLIHTGGSNFGLSVEDTHINPEGTAADDIVKYFLGCKVNELTYSVAREQTDSIRFVANMLGKKPQTNVSGATASSITDFTGSMYTEWDTEIEIASGTDYDLNDFSFSINNNFKARGTDGRFIKKLVPGDRTYKATAKIDLLDKEEIERFYGASNATEPGDTIGSFTVKHTLKKPEYERIEFKFTECTYNKADDEAPLGDVITQDLDINITSCQVMLVEGTEVY